MRVDLFDFELPQQAIASRPVEPREQARLLCVGPDGGLQDRRIADLPELLRADDLLVVNDTRVLPAQLEGRRGDARIELTLHRRLGPGRWHAFARPARKLKPGDRIDIGPGFAATVAAPRHGGEVELDFAMDDSALRQALERHGSMPLPPYIRKQRAVDARDRADYQTVFAERDGAVAAPTAGLHFSPALLARLDAAGIARTTVTLHVGAGTFLPVTVDDTRAHKMHAEYGEVSAPAAEQINAVREQGGRIVAVGTTSLRILEAASEADGRLQPFAGPTELFITPGYRFRCVDVLLTNFHLPRSTLFMLVCAFSGLDTMQGAYRHAIAAGYRFYSYGDACLLERAAAA